MPLYGPSTATATVAANTNSVAITGMDLTAIVQQGMTINFGARDRAIGDAWVINTVAPNGTNGGTLTLAGSVPSGFTNVPFLIDTRAFLGTDSSYAAAVSLKLLMSLSNLLGPATNLFAGARQLVLDKVASSALGRLVFATAGRQWADIVHASYGYTPTGGQATTTEAMSLRAFPNGATPVDAVLIDLSTGTADVSVAGVTMTSGATVDLASAPCGRVTIAGSAQINSFGAGKNKVRDVVFRDNGAILVHNATSLILPNGLNLSLRAGDALRAASDAAGNWRVIAFWPSGLPVAFSSGVSAVTGSLGSGSCTGKYVRLNGRMVAVNLNVTIQSNGTGDGYLVVTLPFSVVSFAKFFGRENAVRGFIAQGFVGVGSNALIIAGHDNSYPGATGAQFEMFGICEVA
ncbi:hypothetical protein ASF33_05305 [Methylobacterium sp. Leaf92]|nr:hypothetical protein ASF33_05305 [Methylobacterium sp. Leaf92]